VFEMLEQHDIGGIEVHADRGAGEAVDGHLQNRNEHKPLIAWYLLEFARAGL
jgi:hypothetical protein